MSEPTNIYDGMSELVENAGLLVSKMEDGTIFLKDGDAWYPIEKDQWDSHSKMVAWIDHLSRKTWVTKEHIKEFIALCFCEQPSLVTHDLD